MPKVVSYKLPLNKGKLCGIGSSICRVQKVIAKHKTPYNLQSKLYNEVEQFALQIVRRFVKASLYQNEVLVRKGDR